MVFIKKVINSDPGTADIVGGDNWDKLDDYFDNVDITPIIAKINTETWIRSGKLKLRDSDNSHSYIINTSNLSTDSTVIFPALTASSDTLATLGMTQTWTGVNTFGDITITDTKNITLSTGTGTKIGTGTTQKLGFFNKTPIAQKAANADTSGATLSELETEVNELKQLLRDYGLLA